MRARRVELTIRYLSAHTAPHEKFTTATHDALAFIWLFFLPSFLLPFLLLLFVRSVAGAISSALNFLFVGAHTLGKSGGRRALCLSAFSCQVFPHTHTHTHTSV